jgi:hypothetical protein
MKYLLSLRHNIETYLNHQSNLIYLIREKTVPRSGSTDHNGAFFAFYHPQKQGFQNK